MIKENNTQDTRQYVIGEFPIPDDKFHGKMVEAYKKLYDGTGAGSEMRDWIIWPEQYFNSEEYGRVKSTAATIQYHSDAVIFVGIGGSYLTPQAVMQSEYGDYYNEIAEKKGLPKVYFAGCDLSPDNLNRIIERVSEVDWSIIYISKSGGTTEPALAFHVLWEKLYEKYGDEANSRVFTVTDGKKGTLKEMTDEHGWETFVIPDGIGGRYSAFTAVGLLPLAIAGINTDELLLGAIDAMNDCYKNPDSFAGQYAEWRYYNYTETMNYVEFFAANTTYLSYFTEWVKQLFGESEGKDGEGLFPASGVFPRDLHSLGQYLQDGLRDLICETFIISEFETDIEIPENSLKDNLENRVGKKFSQAAAAAMDGAYKAHTEGGNPCAIIRKKKGLMATGYLMYALCVVSPVVGYMIDVNPFDQPGVEAHKAAMKTSPEWDK